MRGKEENWQNLDLTFSFFSHLTKGYQPQISSRVGTLKVLTSETPLLPLSQFEVEPYLELELDQSGFPVLWDRAKYLLNHL
jgi:hypothetical protein